MASSNVKVRVKGVDNTSGIFAKIAARAKTTFASVAKVGAGAFAVGAAAFAKGVSELGTISDVAARANTSADALTGMSSALDKIGIKGASIDELATTFQKMSKETGEQGVEGFKKVLGEISKLPTAQERAAAAMKAFGRSGLNFMPLVEAGEEGVRAMERIASVSPKVSQAAADNGDKLKDAFGFAWEGVKNVTLNTIGDITGWLDTKFDGGVRVAALRAVIYFEQFVNKTKVFLFNFVDIAMYKFRALAGIIRSALELDMDGIKESFDQLVDGLPNDVAEQMAKIDETAGKKLLDLQNARLEDAFKTLGSIRGAGGEEAGGSVGSRGEVSNRLVMGGSYAALTAGLRARMRRDDPNTRELKTVNSWLQKVAENTDSSNVRVLNVGA